MPARAARSAFIVDLRERESLLRAPRQLRWLDRSGKPIRTLGEAGYLRTPRLSPDERRVAFCRFDPVNHEGDIWLYDLVRDTETRVTLRQAYYGAPAFSPDGSAIAFASNLAGVQNLFQKVPGGPTEPELLLGTKRLSDWSADGRLLLYSEQDPRLGDDIWALPVTGSRKPFLVLQTPFEDDVSKDGPERFLVAAPTACTSSTLTLLLNWAPTP
jgi:Tol biopolymer transport system component